MVELIRLMDVLKNIPTCYNKLIGVNKMAKVKGTNVRTRPKRHYKKAGSKRGRGVKHS